MTLSKHDTRYGSRSSLLYSNSHYRVLYIPLQTRWTGLWVEPREPDPVPSSDMEINVREHRRGNQVLATTKT